VRWQEVAPRQGLRALPATGGLTRGDGLGNPEKPNVRFSTELKGHASGIEKIAFNPVKDAELCSVSNDGVVKFWDVRTKECVNEVKGLGNTHALAWAPDGSSVLVGNRVGFHHYMTGSCSGLVMLTKPTDLTWHCRLASFSSSHQPNLP